MKRKLQQFTLIVAALTGLLTPFSIASKSYADTTPVSGTPSTVSADPLPTVQINGIVWDEAIVGNTVYATGQFSKARPAGAALGTNETTRTNLLAFDITTGKLVTSFNHSLNGYGQTISASPDGKRLYVGGSFSQADGQARSNLAAFDLTTNTLLSGFTGVNGLVRAVEATNGGVFIGGSFSQVSGQPRGNLAAFASNGTLNTVWKPTVTLTNGETTSVRALLALPDRVIIGGSYDRLNGGVFYGSGAVDRSTGVSLPWKSSSSTYAIRFWSSYGGVTSLSTDGTTVYISGFVYRSPALVLGGTLEGRAAISPRDGSIIWINGCYGDTYDAVPIGQVLYSVGHAHDCSAIGAFPEANPRQPHHALAETTYATGTNVAPTAVHPTPSFVGQPDTTQLAWYPTLNIGTVSGAYQSAWTITGNSQYIALGGEFTTAEGVAQQGLVRYGISSVAPNNIGPVAYPSVSSLSTPADASGRATVTVRTSSDADNGTLLYVLYRVGMTSPVCAKYVTSRFWNTPTFTCVDSGLTPKTAATYKVVISDSFGNIMTGYSPVDDTNSGISYSGTWVNSTARGIGDYADGVHYTQVDGNSATYTFSGNTIMLLTDLSTSRGKIAISVDGKAPTVVDAYSTTTTQQHKFPITGIGSGQHTVKVTKLSGTYMVVDAFIFR